METNKYRIAPRKKLRGSYRRAPPPRGGDVSKRCRSNGRSRVMFRRGTRASPRSDPIAHRKRTPRVGRDRPTAAAATIEGGGRSRFAGRVDPRVPDRMCVVTGRPEFTSRRDARCRIVRVRARRPRTKYDCVRPLAPRVTAP